MTVIKRWWLWWVRFWKGIWAVVKSMGNWKGVLSLLITWLLISGSGVSLLGVIIANAWLIGIGITMYAFWLGPFTPLIPINIGLAMLMQRYVFRDKSVSWKAIKSKFKEAFQKEDTE